MKKNIVIVGGGITGLSSAYILAKQGYSVKILEASDKIGGLLECFPISGTHLEHFYHHFFDGDAELAWLLNELDLSEALQFYDSTIGIFHKNHIYNFTSPKDLLAYSPLSFISKIRFGLTGLYLGKLANWKKHEKVPVVEWIKKYGGQEVLDHVWGPLLQTKFSEETQNIPTSWLVGRMHQRMSSRSGQGEKLGYIVGSLRVVLLGLLKKLEALGVRIETECPVEKINLNADQRLEVHCSSQTFGADNQFLFTLPPPVFAKLWQGERHPVVEVLAKHDFFHACCVVLKLKKQLSPVYWLNIADPNIPFGGVIEQTNLLPPPHYQNDHIVYLSKYFTPSNRLASMSSKDIQKEFISHLPTVFKNYREDNLISAQTFRTPFAAPVCRMGYSEQVIPPQTGIPNLYFANSSHIYPDERSVSNSIRVAANACSAIGVNTSDIPKGNNLVPFHK